MKYRLEMPAYSDFHHISLAISRGAGEINANRERVFEELGGFADSSAVNAFRTLTMSSYILCIGGLSVLEATIQQVYGWQDAFSELDAFLRAGNRTDLAERFQDYKDATNVLKHGVGRSYDRLVARREQLAFRIKGPGEQFLNEGDIGEVAGLIDADTAFAEQIASIVDELVDAISEVMRDERRDGE